MESGENLVKNYLTPSSQEGRGARNGYKASIEALRGYRASNQGSKGSRKTPEALKG